MKLEQTLSNKVLLLNSLRANKRRLVSTIKDLELDLTTQLPMKQSINIGNFRVRLSTTNSTYLPLEPFRDNCPDLFDAFAIESKRNTITIKEM